MTFEDALYLGRLFKSQTTDEEASELYHAAFSTPVGDTLEIGSATGGTTVMLLAAAEMLGRHVYSVDPYPVVYENFAKDYDNGIMTQFKKEFAYNILNGTWHNITQYNSTISECIHLLPHNLSVVFIDSCHEISILIHELGIVFPSVRSGGKIYIHDVLAKVGQLSRTEETGLIKFWDYILANMYDLFQNTRLKCIRSSSGNIMLCMEKL